MMQNDPSAIVAQDRLLNNKNAVFSFQYYRVNQKFSWNFFLA